MDTPSVSIVSADMPQMKTRRMGQGFWAKCRQETYFERWEFRWTLFFCQEG
jgi:hypothetical protein